jgi:hypothetical protein
MNELGAVHGQAVHQHKLYGVADLLRAKSGKQPKYFRDTLETNVEMGMEVHVLPLGSGNNIQRICL